MNIVVSYDISDDGKRARVSNILKDYGARVQYSVFECQLAEEAFEELLTDLKPFAGEGDSITVYHLCEACLKKVNPLGRKPVFRDWEHLVV